MTPTEFDAGGGQTIAVYLSPDTGDAGRPGRAVPGDRGGLRGAGRSRPADRVGLDVADTSLGGHVRARRQRLRLRDGHHRRVCVGRALGLSRRLAAFSFAGPPLPRPRRAWSGSIRAATTSKVDAGRMSPKTSPWTPATATASAAETTYIRVRTTSDRLNPASPSARSTIAHDGSCLRGRVARVLRAPIRARVRRPGHPARVPIHDRPAVTEPRLVRTARRDQPPLVRHDPTTGPAARHRATSGSRPIARTSAATSAVRGTTEATSRYSAGE